MNNRTAPMAILTASNAVDGAVLGFGGLFSVVARVAATTMASDRIQPAMKNAAFDTPLLDASTTAKAVNGMGSKVMAKPRMTRLRTSISGVVLCVGSACGTPVAGASRSVIRIRTWFPEPCGAARWVRRAQRYVHSRSLYRCEIDRVRGGHREVVHVRRELADRVGTLSTWQTT